MIDSIAMKGRRIIIPFLLQKQVLKQKHSNHMGIEKMRLLVRESVYWVNMNEYIKTLHYTQKRQPQKKTVKVPSKSWEVVGADVFSVKNKTVLCTVDYYGTFLIVKKPTVSQMMTCLKQLGLY